MSPAPAAQRLLLIQLEFLGDVLLATPALRAARRAWPHARIEFLTAPAGADALADNPHVDEILTWRRGARNHLALARELRGRGYDVVIDVQSNPRTAQLVAATAARTRVGWRTRGPRNLLYTTLVERDVGPPYAARQKLRLVEALGVELGAEPDLTLDIAIGDAERAWAAAAWAQLGLAAERPVVAVSAVSRLARKQWGFERWAAVADRLAESGCAILLTSGPRERAQAAEVARRMRHAAAWQYPDSTVRQLAALYQRCALWLGNDGGPKHVAVAAGVPTVTVIRHPIGRVWTDLRPGSPHVAVEKPAAGRARRNARHPSLDAVLPDDVVAAALDLLRVRTGA